MTDKLDKKLVEELQVSSQHLAPEYVLSVPFAAIDAALWTWLTDQIQKDKAAPHFKRYRITNGSVRYTLQNERGGTATAFADINIRMVRDQQTYIAITLRPLIPSATEEQRGYLQGYVRFNLIAFVIWLWADQKHMAELLAHEPTPANTAIAMDEEGNVSNPLLILPAAVAAVERPSAGRPPGNDNEWARHEIARGRKREDVLAEYIQRQQIDPDDEEAMERARERFRKALDRTKRT